MAQPVSSNNAAGIFEYFTPEQLTYILIVMAALLVLLVALIMFICCCKSSSSHIGKARDANVNQGGLQFTGNQMRNLGREVHDNTGTTTYYRANRQVNSHGNVETQNNTFS